jgi:hypothetical protein
MKFVNARPYADPDAAARKIVEIADSLSPIWTAVYWSSGSTGHFFTSIKGSPAEYGAGIKGAIEQGWLTMHESGTYLRFTQAGADLFA